MQTTYSEEFINKEIAYLILQIGKINDLITGSKKQEDKLGVWQYTKHRQQFIDQLNGLLTHYQLRISVEA
ncbi:MAG: hypothetical protein JNL70_17050 [Saprospiraceae bacterium]|nr:hypothetical protein [Saprospiraceae bacterium]